MDFNNEQKPKPHNMPFKDLTLQNVNNANKKFHGLTYVPKKGVWSPNLSLAWEQ